MSVEELQTKSDEDLRVMCVELCGWEITSLLTYNGNSVWRKGDEKAAVKWCGVDVRDGIKPMPNYPSDLNAMHEAEKTLPDHDGAGSIHHYRIILMEVCDTGSAITATARQRCIAFICVKQSTKL